MKNTLVFIFFLISLSVSGQSLFNSGLNYCSGDVLINDPAEKPNPVPAGICCGIEAPPLAFPKSRWSVMVCIFASVTALFAIRVVLTAFASIVQIVPDPLTVISPLSPSDIPPPPPLPPALRCRQLPDR